MKSVSAVAKKRSFLKQNPSAALNETDSSVTYCMQSSSQNEVKSDDDDSDDAEISDNELDEDEKLFLRDNFQL